MRTLTRVLVGAEMLALAAAAAAPAQTDVRDTPGRWVAKPFEGLDFPTALVPHRRALEKTFSQILAMLKAAPSVAHPIGFCLTPTTIFLPPEAWWRMAPDPGRWPAAVHLSVQETDHDPNYGLDEAQRCGSKIGTGAFAFDANDFMHLLPRQAMDSDAAGNFYEEPRRLDDYRGFPVYQRSGSRAVVITRSGKPLWVPVSRERFLKVIIANDRQLVANFAKIAGNPYVGDAPRQAQARADAHQKLLDGMSAAERAAPAVLRASPFADNPFEGGADIHLVTPNPVIFDRTRPAGDIQVLLVEIMDFCEGEHRCYAGNRSVRKAIEEIDWNALIAMVR